MSDRRYNFDRRSRDRVTTWGHPSVGYPSVRAEQRDDSLYNRPARGNYYRYRNRSESREYNDSRRFPRFQRGGQPWRRDDSTTNPNPQPDNRKVRRGFRRRGFYSSGRNRPAYRRNAFSRELPAGRRSFQQNQSFSTGATRNQAAERSQPYFRKPQGRVRGMYGQSYSPYNNSPPLRSRRVPSSQVSSTPRRLTEEELKEAQSKWAEGRIIEARRTLPENPQLAAASKAPPAIAEQPQAPETKASTSFLEASQWKSRSEAMMAKSKEIERDYRQDCETFMKVVKKLIEKDPSLKNRIQPAVKQNLWDMGEHYVNTLKEFIAEYDKSRGFKGPF